MLSIAATKGLTPPGQGNSPEGQLSTTRGSMEILPNV